jgi:hypothetical protein
VLYFTIGFTLQYFAATKVQVNYNIHHDFYCEILSGVATGIFITLTGARSIVSVIGPILLGIALFIMSKQQDGMSEAISEVTAIMVTVGKTLSVVLFYSSLPYLISPSIYPLGYGVAYSFVQVVTFVGSRVIGYSDLKYMAIQLSSIIFSLVGFILDKKLRDGVLS